MAISAKRFRNELKEKGIFYTDKALAREMRALFPSEVDEVYDPTCGDGALLSEFPCDTKKFGQDILEQQVEEARRNVPNFTGVIGDTLMNPAFAGKKFKYIVANPPFSVKWDPDKLEGDPRFYGVPTMPPAGKADYAFILHVLHFLADDGMAAVLNFPGILYRGHREGKIREWIVRQNWIEKVIHIPGGHFEDTNIATALVIFKKKRETTEIEFVDTENGISRKVPFDEVKKNGFTLSISTYVQLEPNKESVDACEIQGKARKEFLDSIKRELEIDYTVCNLEACAGKKDRVFSFKAYLDEIREVIDEYEKKIDEDVGV